MKQTQKLKNRLLGTLCCVDSRLWYCAVLAMTTEAIRQATIWELSSPYIISSGLERFYMYNVQTDKFSFTIETQKAYIRGQIVKMHDIYFETERRRKIYCTNYWLILKLMLRTKEFEIRLRMQVSFIYNIIIENLLVHVKRRIKISGK